MHYKVYKTCIADLDNLKHRIRTEWAKLDHAVIAASVHQWHHLSGCVKAGDVHFEHYLWAPAQRIIYLYIVLYFANVFLYYGRPLSVSGGPCYILPMFF